MTKIYDSAVVNRKYELQEVDGVDGGYSVAKQLETRNLSLEINIKDENNIRNSIRIINKWLTNVEDNKLWFEDDAEVYYLVKSITITNATYDVVNFIAVFTVDFVLDSTIYINKTKDIIVTNGMGIRNNYSLSKPLMQLKGEGYINLKVNGVTTKINLGQNLTIDTNYQECFRNGLQAVNVIEGDYENLWLKEGNNTISWTGTGLTSFILTPNWRW